MFSLLLGLVSGLLSGAQSKNEGLAADEYQKKLNAWEAEKQRIEDENRRIAEKRARKQAMASAIGYHGGQMPQFSTPLSAAGGKPVLEPTEQDLGSWARYLSMATPFITGTALPAIQEKYPDVSGSMDASLYKPTSTEYAPPSWMENLNPEWTPSGAPKPYSYESRYQPSVAPLTGGQ